MVGSQQTHKEVHKKDHVDGPINCDYDGPVLEFIAEVRHIEGHPNYSKRDEQKQHEVPADLETAVGLDQQNVLLPELLCHVPSGDLGELLHPNEEGRASKKVVNLVPPPQESQVPLLFRQRHKEGCFFHFLV